jgi:transposase-like protein
MKKKRAFSPEFKSHVVMAAELGIKTAAELCREHELSPNLLSIWRRQLTEAVHGAFERPGPADPAQAEIADLHRTIGRMTVELEAAKKALAFFPPTGGRKS